MLIVHGDNQVLSRQKFLDHKAGEKSAGKFLYETTGSAITLSTIRGALESVSLLGNSTSVFMADFFSGRSTKEKNQIIDYFLHHLQSAIYIWEPKDVSLQLRKFSPQHISKFDLPKDIFRFLDNLSIDNFHLALANCAPEQVFFLLVNHFHQLLLAKEKKGDMSDWKRAKLERQASKYSIWQLTKLYHQLLEIDLACKTSSSCQNLVALLELWLAKL
jgi:hypothetical protein